MRIKKQWRQTSMYLQQHLTFELFKSEATPAYAAPTITSTRHGHQDHMQ